MGKDNGRTDGRGATLACALLFVVFSLVTAVPASRAGIIGSRHNFSSGRTGDALGDPRGACGACHIPHYGQGPVLWQRTLVDVQDFYDQTPPASPPNYVPYPTLLCYDCHDNQVSVTPSNKPSAFSWAGYPPQDIALGGLLAGSPPLPLIGYYEEKDGTPPTGPGSQPPSPPTDGTVTGGHYWKSQPTPVNGPRNQGDKISCDLCHEPHGSVTGTNEVFFRTVSGDGTAVPLGDGMKASKNTRTGAENGPNAGTGREMCESCHGNSNQGDQEQFYNVTVPKPTLGIVEHVNSSSPTATPCTDCHPHNRPAGCNGCHGYPPMLTLTDYPAGFNPNDPTLKYVENYTGGAGAHRRHRDVLGPTIFNCSLCHGPAPGANSTAWHARDRNTGAITATPIAANVDIIGMDAFWGVGSGYSGTGSSVPAQVGYSFQAKGGGNQVCFGLACHGQPPNIATGVKWTDKTVDDATGDAANIGICKWCHDSTPANIPGLSSGVAPNVLGDNNGATGVWTTGTWGADFNGHGLASGNYEKDLVETRPAGSPNSGNAGLGAANKQCDVCHDARYSTLAFPAVNTPVKTHFNSAITQLRLRDTINDQPAINDNPDNTCVACHQVAGGTDSASSNGQVVSHGNSNGDGYRAWETDNPNFRRRCRMCHEPHGANWNGVTPNPRNLHMLGKWLDGNANGQPDGAAMGVEAARVDSNAVKTGDPDVTIDTTDLPVIVKSSGGAGLEENSWDDGNNDGYPGGGNLAESICTVCHVSLVNNHSQVADAVAQNAPGSHMPVGTQCRLCHQHGLIENHPNRADDAFGPLACYACHGVAPLDTPPVGEIAGQFWPAGALSKVPRFNYANDAKGSHRQHVEAIGQRVFGESASQLVLNFTAANSALTAFEKQVEVCKFCHYDPGGADPVADPVPHFEDTTTDNSPAQRADVLQSAPQSGHVAEGPKYFRKFTTGTGPYGRTNYTDDSTGGAYRFTNDSCANLTCHNQNASPVGTGPGTGPNWNSSVANPAWNVPPDWTSGITSTCANTTCHASPATYTLSHAKHSGGGAGQKSYLCTECHLQNYDGTNATTLSASLKHGNGRVDMQRGTAPFTWNLAASIEGSFGSANGYYDKDATTAPSAGDSGFAYKTPPYGACNVIYCHGDDNAAGQLPAADRGTDTTPVWGDPLTAACGDCHAASAATPPGTASHPKHAGAAAGQYAIGCQACHYGTTADGSTINTQAQHANTTVEVSFNGAGDARVDATSSYSGNTVMGSGFGTCSATYCHSRGNDTVAPYNDVPLSVPIAAQPVWASVGPLACSACHGNPGAVSPADPAAPDYVDGTPKANKHEKHSNGGQFACEICHYATTQDGATIASTTLHVNRAYDLAPNAAGPALYQFTWASPNCNAVVCHGGNSNIVWAAAAPTIPYTCDTCHGRVAGAVTNTDVDDFAWGGATPTMSKISNAEYTADGGGHGDATGTHAPAKACADCHDSAVAHDTTATLSGTNPFRLDDQSGTAGVQFSCSYATGCHAAGINTPQTGLDISLIKTHSEAAMEAAPQTVPPFAVKRAWPAWSVGLSCVNCHDPHGDGNRSMVNRWVYDKGAFALPAPAPALPTEQTSLVFTDDTTGVGTGSFANASDYSGICQECHEDASVVSFRDNASVSGTNHPAAGQNPGDCSDCHRHDVGFRPARCQDCHNGSVPLAPDVMPFYDVNGHGAHGVDCLACHDVGSPVPKTHLTGTVETYSFPGSAFGAPNTNTAHLNGSFFGTVGNERDWQLNFDNNCYRNAACHGSPPSRGHRHEMTHKDGVARFGDHQTVVDPKQVRPAPYWTPWTIHDISTDAPPPTRDYAPCVSCHDPHGADYSGYTYSPWTPDRNYHMLRENVGDVGYFCNSNCHRP